MNITNTLDDINLKPDIIYETIVTTINPDNQPNAAAIGVQRVEGDNLKLTIFEGSNTFDNLKNNDLFGINILDIGQYDLAIKAALIGWGDSEPEFEQSEFEIYNNIPFLKRSKCWIVAKIESSSIQEISDEYGETRVMEIIAAIQDLISHEKINDPLTRRDDLPLLEAAVLATRYKVAQGDIQKIIRDNIQNLIDKTNKNNDFKLIDRITQFIDN
jgi:hypothetical protein